VADGEAEPGEDGEGRVRMEVERFAGPGEGQDGPVHLIAGHEEQAELGEAGGFFQHVGAFVEDQGGAPEEAGGLAGPPLVEAQGGEMLAVEGPFEGLRRTGEVDGGAAEGLFRTLQVARRAAGRRR